MTELLIGDYVGYPTVAGNEVGRIVGFSYVGFIGGRWRPLRAGDAPPGRRGIAARVAVDSSTVAHRSLCHPALLGGLLRVRGIARHGQTERLQ